MGCAGSGGTGSEDDKASQHIDKLLKDEKAKIDKEIKLLLLGAGESGKSTIVKQMKIIHHSGFSDDEKKTFRPLIFDNILTAMRNIIRACELFGFDVADQEGAEMLMDVHSTSELSQELGDAIQRLWKDKVVQAAYERSSEYQLIDSAAYYFDNIKRIASPKYLPTAQDILRARVKTTGIIETDFVIDGVTFKLVDVGGQRNERKKWIHCFEDVTAVLFVVAMSEYNQKLYEDEKINRMDESLRLFDEVCNLRWFAETPIILFLNKMDLFEQKLKLVGLDVCFDTYYGGRDVDAAKEFLAQRFVEIAKGRTVYYHFTTATDTTNVRFVFHAARDIVLRETMSKSAQPQRA